MIDRNNRNLAASNLRALIEGRITNEEFMQRFPKSSDPALRAILQFAWGQFSDLRVHTVTGRDAPPPDQRARLERCLLFLQTDLPFEWPLPPGVGKGLLRIVTLGHWPATSDEEYKSKGDFEVWPFLRRNDYESQISIHR